MEGGQGMTKKLSHLINKAKQPEIFQNDQEVMDLIASRKEINIPRARSYRPDRIRRLFKPLILIVMTTLVAVFSLILVFFPAKDIPDTKVPIDVAVKAAPVAVPIDSLQNQVTPQVLIPQNPVKSKPKIKSELPGKEDNPKVVTTRKVSTTEEADSMTNSKIDRAIETGNLGINPIALDSATLSCIGFDVRYGVEILWQSPDGFDRSIRYDGRSEEFDLVWTRQGYKRQTPEEYAKFRLKPVKFVAMSMSGYAKPTTQCHFYGSQFDPSSFDKLLNISIPISMEGFHLTQQLELRQEFEKYIFWIIPTEELINCLPDSISKPMRKEFHKNILPILESLTEKNGKPVDVDTTSDFIPPEELANPVPCLYFPSFCEGLPGLVNFSVYPIPSSDFLNIEILLLQSKKITYRLFDISGRLLNDKLPARNYSEPGQYTEKMDLSGLNSGLYLLVLTDQEGARMTRRILKN